MVYYTCKQEILYILYWEVINMLLRDSTGRSVEFHLFASSGVDFAEDWLDAGSLSRDVDGAYLVDSIDYIIDYATDAVNGCNPDFEGKLAACMVPSSLTTADCPSMTVLHCNTPITLRHCTTYLNCSRKGFAMR
jgi:hypothetical protein